MFHHRLFTFRTKSIYFLFSKPPGYPIVNHSANLQRFTEAVGIRMPQVTNTTGRSSYLAFSGTCPHYGHYRLWSTIGKISGTKLQFEQNYQALLRRSTALPIAPNKYWIIKRQNISDLSSGFDLFCTGTGWNKSRSKTRKEPNPAHLKKSSIWPWKKISIWSFIQSQFDVNNAESVAKPEAKIIQIDPLTENWAAEWTDWSIPWINICLKINMTPILELKNVSAG